MLACMKFYHCVRFTFFFSKKNVCNHRRCATLVKITTHLFNNRLLQSLFFTLLVVVQIEKAGAFYVAIYHFFLCSSMETPPGPKDTTIRRPPITDSVWKKSYFKKSLIGLYAGMVHHALK